MMRFSNLSKPQFKIIARKAVGTAPASMSPASTMASPLKIKSPRPPPPTRKLMAAVPTLMTTAVRMPVRMMYMAFGISTLKSTCRGVMPMPWPASTSAGSTWKIPATVLRMMGSRL